MSRSRKEVRERIEKYRQALGLKPWDQYAAEVMEKHEKTIKDRLSLGAWLAFKHRMTGRSTYGIIKALALASLNNKSTVVIEASNPTHEKALVDRARAMASALNLDVKVIMSRQEDAVRYVDHTTLPGSVGWD